MAAQSSSLNGKPDHRTLLEVQDAFNLPSPALVEKDWHVVHALAAIQGATSDGLTLVFGGGTALGRAHGLLDRMSEDIDLRVIGDRAESRPALKRLRGEISNRLADAGFAVDGHVEVKQNDRYVRYDLPYAPIMRGEGVLRPEIKIEIAAFPLRMPSVGKSVRSFCAQAHDKPAEVALIDCVALSETAAEKFVALTRRAGEAFARGRDLDPTLVRHVYDLFRLEGHYDADEAVLLAHDVMKADVERGYDAYKADPLAETRLTAERLAGDADFRDGYDSLMANMVYGDQPDFELAMAVFARFAGRMASTA